MAYMRQEVTDGITVFDKKHYDNLQDGIEESKESIRRIDESLGINPVLEATVEE